MKHEDCKNGEAENRRIVHQKSSFRVASPSFSAARPLRDNAGFNRHRVFRAGLFFSAALLLGCIISACRSGGNALPPLTEAQHELLTATRLPYESPAFAASLDSFTKSSGDLNFRDPKNGKTPLLYAIENADKTKTNLLLEAGADPMQGDSGGNTAMHYAASAASSDMLRLLLTKKLPLDPRNHSGKTPLMEAARLGNFDNFSLLLDAGADATLYEDGKRNSSAFAAMSASRALDMIRLMEEKGVFNPEVDANDKTPLLYAIDAKNTDAARYLLAKLPDFNRNDAVSAYAYLLMRHAIYANEIPVVKDIVAKKLELNSDVSIVFKAMRLVNIEGVFKLMARNHMIRDGKKPLFWAAETDNTAICELLIDAGSSPLMTDNSSNTPIAYARRNDTIQYLQKAEKEYRNQRNIGTSDTPGDHSKK